MNNQGKVRKKIESLQALRAIAFIGIFLSHAGAKYNWSALGVSVFYVMSGFLMIYTHFYDDISTSLKNNLNFSLKRIFKLYPLHIITMIFAILLDFAIIIHEGASLNSFFILVVKILLNVTLLQTWFPDTSINTSLNGVAWFLSVMIFLYFMFPYILKPLQKINCHNKVANLHTRHTPPHHTYNTHKLLFLSVFVLALQIAATMPMIIFKGIDENVQLWFTYCFPIFHLGDFIIGCNLGTFYLCYSKLNMPKTLMSIIEIIATACTVLVCMWLKQEHHSIIAQALNNNTTIYILLATIWIYLFSINNGIITQFFNNKFLRFIGNISSYTFLIHYVITQLTHQALAFLNINLTGFIKYLVIIMEFAVTILIAVLYKKKERKIQSVFVFLPYKSTNRNS